MGCRRRRAGWHAARSSPAPWPGDGPRASLPASGATCRARTVACRTHWPFSLFPARRSAGPTAARGCECVLLVASYRPPNMRPSRRTVRPTYEGARFWVCCRGEGPGGVWGVGRTGALPPGSRPRQGGQGCPWTGPRSGPPRCVTREPLR